MAISVVKGQGWRAIISSEGRPAIY